MEDLILHPDIAEPVMTLSERDMGTLFKALMIYRWRGEEPKDLSAAADMAGRDSLALIVNGHGEQTMVTALFDNLGKGASGAAVQNMNLMLGFEETAGLAL